MVRTGGDEWWHKVAHLRQSNWLACPQAGHNFAVSHQYTFRRYVVNVNNVNNLNYNSKSAASQAPYLTRDTNALE
jgi:hypothetical protein